MRRRNVGRGFAIWALLMLAEVLHGTARVLVLAPLVGDFRSRQIGVVTGSIIFLVLAFVFIGWIGARDSRELFGLGALWVVWTLAFELVLGRYVFDQTWERLLSDYAIWKGGLMPVGLLTLGLAPWIATQAKRIRSG